MKKILTIFTVLFSLNAAACSCEWGGNFIKAAPFSEFIFKGKVIERVYHTEDGKRYLNHKDFLKAQEQNDFDDYYGIGQSIKVEVLEIIKGEEERRVIEVFDTDGADCRASVSSFEVGKTYVFASYKPNRTGRKLPNETKNDYAVGACYESSLEYFPKTNEVYGAIRGKSFKRKNRKYSYKKLKKKILCQ